MTDDKRYVVLFLEEEDEPRSMAAVLRKHQQDCLENIPGAYDTLDDTNEEQLVRAAISQTWGEVVLVEAVASSISLEDCLMGSESFRAQARDAIAAHRKFLAERVKEREAWEVTRRQKEIQEYAKMYEKFEGKPPSDCE